MEAHNTQNKNDYPEVIQGVGLNGLDYSKISVSDFCYFLNDRVDLARNGSYFDGYDPDEFPESEMYEFLKFKTDNFDKIKFQLVFDEIRLFTPLFYKIVDDDIIDEESYNSEWNTDDKLHDYIERTLELNDGLFLHCEQIKQFSLLAEKLYQSINDTSAPDTATKTQPMKLTTELNQVRMKAIHQWLTGNSYIKVDIESWLYWFDLQTWINKKKNPSKIKWIGAVYHLTNVVYLLCGNMNKQTETAMKDIFQIPEGREFQKLTKGNIQKDVEPYKSMDSMMNYAERFIKDK